ncbi:MAG: hypothetical protein HQK65_02315 [Desulfamplus sp.]|nr:hypothetical protein [Desulfamplus sp.]
MKTTSSAKPTFDICVKIGTIFEASSYNRDGQIKPVRNLYVSPVTANNATDVCNPYGVEEIGNVSTEETFKAVTFNAAVVEALDSLKSGDVVVFRSCRENARTYTDKNGKTVNSVDTVFDGMTTVLPSQAVKKALKYIESSGLSRETWRNANATQATTDIDSVF